MSLLCDAGLFVFCRLCVFCMCGVHAMWSGCTVSLGVPVVCTVHAHSMVTSKETIYLLLEDGVGGREDVPVERAHHSIPNH